MRYRLDFPAEPSSVRAARLFVVDKLQEWKCDDLVDSAALVTSELATNALVHTGQPYSVQVERSDTGVRVEVIDAGHELPRLREYADLGTPDGADDDFAEVATDVERLFSGLRIVDSVAAEWGSSVLPGEGKVVWFELLDDPSTHPRERVSDLRDLRDLDAPVLRKASSAIGVLDELGDDAADQPEHLARNDDLLEYPSVSRHLRGWGFVVLLLVLAVGGFLLFGR